VVVIFIVVVVVTKDNTAAADDDDADAVFLIEIEIDQGVVEVVVFVITAKVTMIDSMTLIDDDDDDDDDTAFVRPNLHHEIHDDS